MTGKSSSSEELGEFLRVRRAAVTPQELGIQPSYGDRRRVPGLRREELAELAGLSTTYYTRLEQGESHQVSDAILDALARALKLSPDERAHLYRLARALPPVRGTGREDRVRGPIRDLVDSSLSAVVLVGRRTDILAGNPLGYALWRLTRDEIAAVGTPQAPNQARRVFLDPRSRELFADWERQAEDLRPTCGWPRRSGRMTSPSISSSPSWPPAATTSRACGATTRCVTACTLFVATGILSSASLS